MLKSYHSYLTLTKHLVYRLILSLISILFILACLSSNGRDSIIAQNEELACVGDGIYLYEHSDFQGACRKFTAHNANLADLDFDNLVSSVQFVGSFRPYLIRTVICDQPNYGGTCSPFYKDDNNFGDNYIGHDHASSILIENVDYGDSLRIATFNIQYFPHDWFFSLIVPDGCCEDIGGRPTKFAERFLAGDYDILALQEAFDDEIQDGLTNYLKEYYPHFMKIVHDCDTGDQDSGLILLSRFPFEPLFNANYKADGDCLSATNGIGSSWGDVAYREYEDEQFLCYTCPIRRDINGQVIKVPPYMTDACGGSDCYADKGIAFVRIKNPRNEQTYNIAFTHLNAGSGPGEGYEIRRAQFGIIEKVIRSQMNDDALKSEHLFMLGDLNTNGLFRFGQEMNENWIQTFNTPGSFFTDVLSDVWYFRQTTLPASLIQFRDQGNTADTMCAYQVERKDDDKCVEGQASRIDYVLYNYPEVTDKKKLCIQHLTVAFNLRHGEPYVDAVFSDAGSNYITDHQGVNADINLWAERCSPDEAYVNPHFDQAIPGQITYPGSMQWYRLDPFTDQTQNFSQNGTYSIYLEGDPRIDFQVFESGHLSSPLIRSGNRSTSSTWTFTVPKQPFYIRVFAHDRTLKNTSYRLFIHRHEGTYQDEAIGLLPSEPYLINTTNHVNSQRPVWFRLDTEAPDSGTPQNLYFFVEGDPGASIELRNKDGLLLDQGIGSISPPAETAGIYNNQYPLYMIVRFQSTTTAKVGWSTNLSIFHSSLEQPFHLRSADPTEDDFISGTDDIIAFKMTVDSSPTIDLGGLGNIDDQQIRGMSDKIPTVKFLNRIHFEIVEDDAQIPPACFDFDGCDDHMHGDLFPLEGNTFQTYRSVEIKGDGGNFPLNYTISHGLNIAFEREPFMTDLAVDTASQFDSIVAGSLQTYTVNIANIGPGRATGAKFAMHLPVGITLISAPSSGCQASDGLITCNLGVISSGANMSIPLVLSTDPTIEERTILPLSVQAEADQPDLTSDNDNAAASISIVRRSDLSVTQTLSSTSVQAGSQVIYTVDVRNRGDSIATNVILTNTLPSGVNFDTSTSSSNCDLASGVITCKLGLILDSEAKEVTIAGRIALTAIGGSEITNIVSVGGDETDPNMENNTSELATNILSHVYLPLITHPGNVDLIVKSIVVTPEDMYVTIQNVGETSAKIESGLWVDVYINPNPLPSAVNEIWTEVATSGLVWSRVLANSELQPGAEHTLHINDGYYLASHSSYPNFLPAGSVIYAQVDSTNANTSYGAVLEGHEASGKAYNNIAAITLPEAVSTTYWPSLTASNEDESGIFEIQVPRE